MSNENTRRGLLEIMSGVSRLRLSESRIVDSLLIGELRDRLNSGLLKAVEIIVGDCVNESTYRRSIVSEMYAVTEAISEMKDKPSDIQGHILENMNIKALENEEAKIANRIASKLLPLFHPTGYSSWRLIRNVFSVRPVKMEIFSRLQESLAAERNRHLVRAISQTEGS